MVTVHDTITEGTSLSRTARLLELMIAVRRTPRFTVEAMASEFGVSRRTMLRDLRALLDTGVPLVATPGPHGGYALIAEQRMLPLSLTVDEALGMVLSYEALLQYAESPFAAQSLSAITKLRNAIPRDTVQRLDELHRHVAIVEPVRAYHAPLLAEILQAALDGVHLRIVYESRSATRERVIFPHGLYAAEGFWYCVCHDSRRDTTVSLRADRFRSLERVPGLPAAQPISLREWLRTRHSDAPDLLPLRARLSRQAAQSFQIASLFGEGAPGDNGESLEASIPASEIEWYATQLLALGAELVIESPPQLIAVMRRRAAEVVALYSHPSDSMPPPTTQAAER